MRLLRIHTPSGHLLGTCWCQRNMPPPPSMTEQEAWECIERSYWRNWGGVEE